MTKVTSEMYFSVYCFFSTIIFFTSRSAERFLGYFKKGNKGNKGNSKISYPLSVFIF